MVCPVCKKETPVLTTYVAYIGEDLNDLTCTICNFKGTKRDWLNKSVENINKEQTK